MRRSRARRGLCPSFYRAEIISNPDAWERFSCTRRHAVIAFLQRRIDRRLTESRLDDVAETNGHCTTYKSNAPDERDLAPRAITIAILAMGGEGGGVLADWIVDLAEHAGYFAQTTSVPGVAQRTGATIYYVEIFPRIIRACGGKSSQSLALMPVPGEVDIVIASELMEAGRAIQRGLVTPDRTTLIASTHRVYSMTEKTRSPTAASILHKLIAAGGEAARVFVRRDFARIARETRSVISAALFGALAASGRFAF